MTSKTPLSLNKHLRKFGVCWFLVFACLASPVCASDAADFVIVRNGKPACVILTSADSRGAVSEAVEELNYWVRKISGTTLPILSIDQWDEKTPYIAVGESWIADKNGWSAPPFAQEEARVFVEKDKIGLLGNDRSPYPDVEWPGTYYAVLEFVKKKLGVRWIWPGPLGEVWQPSQNLSASPGAWKWAPDLTLIRSIRNGYETLRKRQPMEAMMRDLRVSREEWEAMAKEHEQWLKRERMNRSTDLKFGHAFSQWWTLYGETHPEWFARPPEGVKQLGGRGVKLNLSNREVQDKVFQDWLAAWKQDPSANRFLNVAPNDSRGFDTRPETRAWDAPELASFSDKDIYNGSKPVLSDRYVRFWNILARRIREVDPSARLATYAYRNYRTPPLGAEKLEDNIIVAYCGGEGYYPDEHHILEEWKGWRERGAGLSWRPNLLNGGHGIPYLFSTQLFEDFRALRHHSLLGTDFDSLVGNWSGQGLMYYVLAEQHSRPEASYEELAGEYFRAFGPAADAVREYHEFFERVSAKGPRLLREHRLVVRETWGGWWDAHIRLIPILLTPEVLAEGDRIIGRATAAAVNGTETERRRVDLVAEGFRHAQLMADTFRKLRLQDPRVSVRNGGNREVLKPLWDFRNRKLVTLGQAYVTLFMEEQRQLGLWNDYVGSERLADSNVPNRVFPVTESWQAKIDLRNQGVRENWQTREARDWKKISVAMPWRRALPDLEESKVIWYRTPLSVPDLADTGERVILRFGSVDAEVRIWLNGELIAERGYPHNGNYDSWREPFEVDVSRWVNPGGKNELVLRVESESANAGITGPVVLVLGK
jgi:hypothetical protein